ncbi:MAG TPA: carboxypeptidase M32 [Gaiellales bacterium]|nr:carboxypeptidase M32 [Gaiellales bacterium]
MSTGAATASWVELLARTQELSQLRHASSLLRWDQQVLMPAGAGEGRGGVLATVDVLRHRLLTDEALGELLDLVDDELPSDRRALVRLLRRDRDQAVRLPPDLVRRLAVAEAVGHGAWEVARRAGDFSVFRPHLERMVALKREQADLLGHDGERYDALLDLYEPGMRTARIEPLFAALAGQLGVLVDAIGGAPAPVDRFAGRRFDDAGQWRLTMRVLSDIGFDLDHGRQDRSTHPFTSTVSPGDVRVTTRIDELDGFSGLFSTLHEAGHGLYEQGFDPVHAGTPLADAPSYGLHESQSRMWENLVGRDRPFWQYCAPIMREIFPEVMDGVGADDLHAHLNRVERSLIRVEADEVTYNLHILIRFELELALLRGDLEAADLPTAWNEAYERRLGVRPPHDGVGVLQDTHWSDGSFGYFPSYTLGNLYSVLLWNRLRVDLPDLDASIAVGRFAPLLGWLREHVHRRGAELDGEPLIEHVTGSGLDHEPFVTHLWDKYAQILPISRPR